MTQPKVGQKFRIKSLPNRVFKCVSDDDVYIDAVICENCAFYNGKNTDNYCRRLLCKDSECHYIEVPNVKTKK